MFPGLDLSYYTDLAQLITTTGKEPDYLDHDVCVCPRCDLVYFLVATSGFQEVGVSSLIQPRGWREHATGPNVENRIPYRKWRTRGQAELHHKEPRTYMPGTYIPVDTYFVYM